MAEILQGPWSNDFQESEMPEPSNSIAAVCDPPFTRQNCPKFTEVSFDLYKPFFDEVKPAMIKKVRDGRFCVKKNRKSGFAALFIQLGERFFLGHGSNVQVARLLKMHFEEMLSFCQLERYTLNLSNI